MALALGFRAVDDADGALQSQRRHQFAHGVAAIAVAHQLADIPFTPFAHLGG